MKNLRKWCAWALTGCLLALMVCHPAMAEEMAETLSASPQATVTQAPTPTAAPETPAVQPTETKALVTDVPLSDVPVTDVPATDAPATDIPVTDVAQTATPEPTADLTQQPTQVPAQTPEATTTGQPDDTVPPAETATPEPEEISLMLVDEGWEVYAGQAFSLALPVVYELDGVQVASNEYLWQDEQSSGLLELTYAEYLSGEYPGSFTAEIMQVLSDLEVRMVSDQASYDLFGLTAPLSSLVVSGNSFSPYALFEGLTVRPDAAAGEYELRFEIYYTDRSGLTNRAQEPIRESVFLYVLEDEPADDPTEHPTPDVTGEPTDEPTDRPTDQPDATPFPEGEGRLMLGQVQGTPDFKVKSTVSLHVPVSYVVGTSRLYSNHDDSGSYVPYSPDASYSQNILQAIEYLELEITPEMAADPSCPVELSQQGVPQVVIADGVNRGYAVFEDLVVKKDLSGGVQAVMLLATYRETGSDELKEAVISLNVNITGVSSGYSGGGGGGYVAPTAVPQARLIVEKIATDPADVTAGDTFDLVFTIRNTSASQYVQNIRATIGAQDDVLLPLSGSNTVYISRIDANTTYELRYPVSSSLSVPETALKVDVLFEYEDQAVSSQTASQTLNIQVAQLQRIKIDDPITDSASPTEGDSYDVSLQVINEGRTTLYNVTVTAQAQNENLLLPASYYLGNMESGSSKKAELTLVPLTEGQYVADLVVSYEDGRGQLYTETKNLSFWCDAEQTYDYSWNDSYNQAPESDTWEDEGSEFMDILSLMPWWIYAAAGALFLLIVISIGTSAHSKHVKALEDDEMD